ncbi:uncharacterized protein LOC133712306 [Rosa rugosa]|uniref:uncharacterized protein LOC133712306 n=1 Tax=Rosa rugosa TaxID=74645 RepID=UPI002B40B0C2|nr:uncharacterized protein LOC133712306 [Rosa rugosa]
MSRRQTEASKRPREESSSGPVRKIHSERNVDLVRATSYPPLVTLRAYISSRGLTNLASKNDAFDESCVRDFYRGFPPAKPTIKEVVVKIRKKQITLSPAFIQDFLDLPHISEDEIEKFEDKYNELTLPYLAEHVLESKDAYKSRVGQKVHQGDFPQPYRTFWQFVRRNISPHTQKSEIPTVGGNILVLMVANEIPIPFALIIYEAIISCAYGSSRSQLVFPCLISRICKTKKVPQMSRDDKWLKAYSPLDDEAILRSEAQITNARHGTPSSSSIPTPSSIPTSFSLSSFDISTLKGRDARLLARLQIRQNEEIMRGIGTIMARLDLMGAPPAPMGPSFVPPSGDMDVDDDENGNDDDGEDA